LPDCFFILLLMTVSFSILLNVHFHNGSILH
jgi:hypothetical protein